MQEITKVQRFTQGVQLTTALMIAMRAGLRLRAEIESTVRAVAEDHETAEGVPFGMDNLAAVVKRMQDSLSENLRKATREAEGRD
jgi:hypothetical protein